MTKLKAADIKARDAHAGELSTAFQDLEMAVEAFNNGLEKLWNEQIVAAVDAYNEKLIAAREWAQGIADDAQNYIDEKSEKWQEGDKGQQVIAFAESWREFSPEEIELDKPEELSLDDIEQHSEELDQLPEDSA